MLRLILRNACRSAQDLLYYGVTLTLLSAVMTFANGIAVWGRLKAGFQTASLPILIALIVIILSNFVHQFSLKRRSLELANYLLLGMNRNKLARMIFGEFLVLGLFSFLAGSVLGSVAVFLVSDGFHAGQAQIEIIDVLVVAWLQSAGYFGFIELITSLMIHRRLKQLTIRELLLENKRSQPLRTPLRLTAWRGRLIFCLIWFFVMLAGIAVLPEDVMQGLISVIFVPLLFTVICFYQWLYRWFWRRRREVSFRGSHCEGIMLRTWLTSDLKKNVMLDSVFSLCLIFSGCSCLFGAVMLQPVTLGFEKTDQLWMGFLQICLSVVFLILYFCILSLLVLMQIRAETHDLKILSWLGISPRQIRRLLQKQATLRMSLPAIPAAVLIFLAVPLINQRLNALLTPEMQNLLLIAAGGFSLIFLALFAGYVLIASRNSAICKAGK